MITVTGANSLQGYNGLEIKKKKKIIDPPEKEPTSLLRLTNLILS